MIRSFTIIIFLLCFLSVFSQKSKKSNSESNDEAEIEFRHYFYEANKEKMLGNYNEAMTLYAKCLEINPQSSSTMFEISRILYSLNDVNAAIKLLENAVKISPENIWYNLFLSEIYKSKNLLNKSIEVFKSLVKSYPDNIDFAIELVHLYINTNRIKDSEKLLESLNLKYYNSSVILEEKVKLYLVTKDYQKVISNLNTLISISPEEYRYKNVLAETYYQLKDYTNALLMYESLMESDEYKTSAILKMASIYIFLGKDDLYIKTLVALFNQKEFSLKDKISIYVNDVSKSRDSLTVSLKDTLIVSLVRTHPDSAQPHLLYADYLIKSGNNSKALDHLYTYIKIDQSNYFAYEQILYIENGKNNFDSVISVSHKALELFPNQSYLYFYNAFGNFQKEKYELTISILNSGLIYVTEADLRETFYQYIAESYFKLNNKIEAYKEFEKILKANPTNSVVLNNYSYYLSLDNSELNKALEMSILANTLEKNNYIYQDTHAWILFKMKNYPEALKIIEQAISAGGDTNAEIIDHYGDILFKSGQKEQAVMQWKKALEFDPENKIIKQKINTQNINE